MMEHRFRPPAFQRSDEKPEALYERTVNTLARQFIYNEGELDWLTIEREIQAAREHSGVRRIDEERRDLETLNDLLQGIAAHEKTNAKFLGAWQAALNRQKTTHPEKPVPPETLTRDEVAMELESFAFKQNMLFYEREALKRYERLLEQNPKARIELSKNISLDRSDIEVLIIDIKTRIAERKLDEEARRAELQELDRHLAEVIAGIPKEQGGKKFELEEIYLLRRLIHNADTGYLASVSHGTPRQDLRPDRGSVDIVVAAAGEVFEFQLKTFKRGVGHEARVVQHEVRARAEQKLKGTETQLVVLQGESVQDSYEASLRQAAGTQHTLADKFSALEPLTKGLKIKERERLLFLTGLTEEELDREQQEFDARQGRRKSHEEELKRRREEEERKFAEGAERVAALERAELQKEQDRLARIEADKEKKQRGSAERMLAEREASDQKARALEAKQREALAEEQRKREEAEAKAAKAETKASKEAEKKWVQSKLDQLGKPDALIAQGFLNVEDRNKPVAILAAKKLLTAKYPNPKSVLKEFPFEK
jgi:hypothetical protein